MKDKIYRDCIVECKREKSLGGPLYVYYSAYTESGYEICCDFTESNMKDALSFAKFAVDEFLDEYKGDEDKHSDRWSEYIN